MTIDDTRKKWLALIVLCLGDLLIVLDVSIVNVALPSIREDLGFSESSLAWVLNAYTLTFGGFMLLAGRLGDLYGHRRVFVLGVGLFTPLRWRAGSRPPSRCSSARGRSRESAAPSSPRSRSR